MKIGRVRLMAEESRRESLLAKSFGVCPLSAEPKKFCDSVEGREYDSKAHVRNKWARSPRGEKNAANADEK